MIEGALVTAVDSGGWCPINKYVKGDEINGNQSFYTY